MEVWLIEETLGPLFRKWKKWSEGYAKIWGETKFQLRSGSKVMSVEEERKRERKKERAIVGNNNG